MPAGRSRLEDRNQIALPLRRFDLDHGVGPLRERRSGRDLDRRAGLDDNPAPPPGPGLANAAENGGIISRGPESLFAPHRIAVHGRAVEGGDWLARHDVAGQDPPRALPEIDRLRPEPFAPDARSTQGHRPPQSGCGTRASGDRNTPEEATNCQWSCEQACTCENRDNFPTMLTWSGERVPSTDQEMVAIDQVVLGAEFRLPRSALASQISRRQACGVCQAPV